jgi:hypothetical protein
VQKRRLGVATEACFLMRLWQEALKVQHILTETSNTNHELTPTCKRRRDKCKLLIFVKEKTQKTLFDFNDGAT